MSQLQQILDAIDKGARAFEEYKSANEARLKLLEKGEVGPALEIASKMAKIDGDISKWANVKTSLETEMTLYKDRIEELEMLVQRPLAPGAGGVKTSKEAQAYRSDFEGWIRAKGMDANLEQSLQKQMRAAHERKDITIGSPAGGGYAVPEEIRREIERLELKFSPVRNLVSVVQVGTSDYKELISLRGATSGWVGEAGSRTATATPTLREIVPTHGELYAYPQVSEWALDDIFFNVEAWLADEVAQEFAYQEGVAVISGNGSTKPTGMLNTTPVLTTDEASPMRAAAAYQYIASDTDTLGSPKAPGITPDSLIDLVYTLNSAYRASGTWIMNSLTTAAVRKLKDTTGQYLWQPSLQVGQPQQLLGYPLQTWEQLPDIAANNFPLAFGDWKRAYVLVDRTGLRITRDNVTNPGFVKFYIRRREGGIVRNNDAAKWLRTIQ